MTIVRPSYASLTPSESLPFWYARRRWSPVESSVGIRVTSRPRGERPDPPYRHRLRWACLGEAES
jgi:hypothetical protein